MAQLREKVMSALRAALADAADLLEQTASGRVTGVVVSRAFDGRSHEERQQMIAAALNSALTVDELSDLGPIVAMTPNEAHVQI